MYKWKKNSGQLVQDYIKVKHFGIVEFSVGISLPRLVGQHPDKYSKQEPDFNIQFHI